MNPLIFLSGSPRPAGGITVITGNVTSDESSSAAATITDAVNCTAADFLVVDFLAIASTNFSNVSVAYNGDAMTQAYREDIMSGLVYYARFYLVAPDSGTNNVVITFTGSNFAFAAWGCTPMSGVHQTVPVGTSDVDTGSSSAPSVTVSSATGELVLATVWGVGATVSANGAGQTTIWTQNQSTIGDQLRQTSKAGETSTVSSWTLSGSTNWAAGATPIKPA